VRIQDGPKGYYFCRACENRFQRLETPFASSIFDPVHNERVVSTSTYPYDDWCYDFVVSLSWRVLVHIRETLGFSKLSSQLRTAVDDAFETWRTFLLDHRGSTQPYRHHLFILDLLEERTAEWTSGFFNRYALLTLDFDLLHADQSVIVFSKFGKLAAFSCIRGEEWSGSLIERRVGLLSHHSLAGMPSSLAIDLNHNADITMSGMRAMSPRQKAKVTKWLLSNTVSEEVRLAAQRDIELFGPAATPDLQPDKER